MNAPLTLYDTTLRDGTQGEGIQFSLQDKLRVARQLAEFGMHYIEGGWPGSNEKDIEFFREAARMDWGTTRIAAFGSTRRAKVAVQDDPQVRLLLEAATPTVTFFGKSWLLHVEQVLRTTPEENLAMIRDTVAYLKSQGREVIYDAEHFFDGFYDRSDYALACVRAAAEAGADTVVLCDTNGGRLPHEVAEATRAVIADLGSVTVGIHTHNDCGLAVANAIEAIRAGARQVQGTMNGYGERTGNCNLTTVIPILNLKLNMPVVSAERLAQLSELSYFVDEVANQNPDPRAPFVGISSFAHKGGMHVNAIHKTVASYEHIRPELVGNRQRILVGELSGRTNVMMKARQLGIDLDEKAPETRRVLEAIKSLENQGFEFEAADASFELLVRRELGQFKPKFELCEYHTTMRHSVQHGFTSCEATVKVRVGDELHHTVASGDGPVNALDQALRKALLSSFPSLSQMRLIDYKVRIFNANQGTAARTRVLIESTDGQRQWGTVGVSDNVIAASWIALCDSVEFFLQQSAVSVHHPGSCLHSS